MTTRMRATNNRETAARRGGRRRSPEADRAILDAAARLLRQEGYARLSVERIAAEAGVGKTTIYRRYRDRQELAAAAAVHVARHRPFEASRRAGARTNLVAALAHLHRAIASTAVLAMLGTLLAEQHQAPAHLQRFWEHVMAPHQAAIRSIIEGGSVAGEVRDGVSPAQIAESMVGSLLARQLSGAPVTSEWMESAVAVVWEGVGRTRAPARQGRAQRPKSRTTSQSGKEREHAEHER